MRMTPHHQIGPVFRLPEIGIGGTETATVFLRHLIIAKAFLGLPVIIGVTGIACLHARLDKGFGDFRPQFDALNAHRAMAPS